MVFRTHAASLSFVVFCLITILFLPSKNLFGQVKVASDLNLATPAHPSAVLDVYSTDKGMLPPRMTTTQRNLIPAPGEGLLIYNTTEDCINEFMGGVWKTYCDLRFSTVCNCVEYLKDNGLSTQVWIPLGSRDWTILGNAGTNPSFNFLGTTDNQALSIRVNDIEKWRFETKGVLSFKNTGSSVFIGQFSGNNDDLSNNRNVFVGTYSGFNNTTGAFNVALGYNALVGNQTGTSNVAIGNIAMTGNISGSDNVAVGAQALRNLTTGGGNVAVGRTAVAANANAGGIPASFSEVVGVGRWTFTDKSAGNYSVAMGTRACDRESTGSHNSGIGGYAIRNNYTGSYNSSLGYLSGGFPNTTSNFTNTSSIGYGTTVTASNKVRLGNTAVTVVEGQVAYSWPSDGRFKSNIKENVPGLDFVMGLRPVTYKFDTKQFDEFLLEGTPDSIKTEMLEKDYSESQNITHTGFIAQEIETLVNDLGYDFDGLNTPKNESDNYSVSYSTFVVPLVKAVQEQQSIIEELKEKETSTQAKLDALEQKLQALEKLIQD